jgi:hypothetical protein
MLLKRRELLGKAGLLAAAVATGGAGLAIKRPGAVLNVNQLAHFVDPLPIPRLAKSIEFRPDPSDHDHHVPFYRIEMREFEAKLHRDLKPTLPEPVAVQSISVFPAKRVDFVIDFSGRAGQTIMLKNLATNNLQFRVVSPSAADSSTLPARLRPLKLIDAREAIQTRRLTLSECDDSQGRSKMMLLDNKRFSAPVSEKPL